jgi:hypothetical protein
MEARKEAVVQWLLIEILRLAVQVNCDIYNSRLNQALASEYLCKGLFLRTI